MAKWWKRALGLTGRDRATALVTQGFVAAKEGRLDDAHRAYAAAVDADDTLAVAHLNLGLCRLDLYNRALARGEPLAVAFLDDVVAVLQKANALEPTIPGLRALAHVEERRGRFAKADEAWERVEATAAGATPVDGAVLHEARDARKALQRKAEADRARERALFALKDGMTAEARKAALAELLRFVEEPGLVPRGYALAGSLARKAGERSQARLFLEQAAAADRSDVDTLREIASICLDEGDLQRALAASLDAYRERPTDCGLVCNVGVCHLGLGDVDKAAEFIDLAHELDPKDPIVLRARDALQKARTR